MPAGTLPYRLDDDAALIKRFVTEASATNVVQGTAKSTLGTLRYVLVPVTVADDSSIGLYVAAYDLDATLDDVAEASRTYALVALIALALIGLVAWFVAGRLLRPIRLLRQAAAANTAADLSERIPVTGHDDVSELTETINGMFDRLQDAFTSQRRLINDVGHELKTPLTIIRGHLELLDTASGDDVDATRELAIDELDRMSNLVSEISLLAESRAPRFVHPEEVDVETLTAAVASKAAALDPGRDGRWSPRRPGSPAGHPPHHPGLASACRKCGEVLHAGRPDRDRHRARGRPQRGLAAPLRAGRGSRHPGGGAWEDFRTVRSARIQSRHRRFRSRAVDRVGHRQRPRRNGRARPAHREPGRPSRSGSPGARTAPEATRTRRKARPNSDQDPHRGRREPHRVVR